MGDFFSPQTETTPREPGDVTQFRTGTLQPFLQGLFTDPTGEFSFSPGQTQTVTTPGLGPLDPQTFTFQGPATSTGNPFSQFLAQSPQQQVASETLSALASGGGFGAGQQVVEAAQPQFAENLQQASAEFTSQTPSTFNTATGAGLGNLQQGALNDFNLFARQALAQGQQRGLEAANLLGQQALQRRQQFINPTLALMQGAFGLSQPIPAQVTEGPSLFSDILGAGATVAGGALGA